MALITKIESVVLERDVPHKQVRCTFSVVSGDNGEKYLQLDTYGSATRVMPDKKSQSLRFTTEALQELLEIIRDNDLAGR
jgi:hypothetical protein